MKHNPVKEKLYAGQPQVGPIMGFNAPFLAEMFAYAGYDFVIFDAEHGPLSEETCENLVRTAEAAGIPAIVRCALNIPQYILRYADTGCIGLHIPQINTVEDAQTAVRAIKYHPMGLRGLAGVRALEYGAAGPLSEKIKVANKESLVIAHIENVEGAKNIKELCKVDGIDVFFVGTSDLSQSMGIPAQYDHPDLLELRKRVMNETIEGGKIPGTIARNGEDCKQLLEMGFKYIIVGAAGLVMSGAKSFLAQARG